MNQGQTTKNQRKLSAMAAILDFYSFDSSGKPPRKLMRINTKLYLCTQRLFKRLYRCTIDNLIAYTGLQTQGIVPEKMSAICNSDLSK